MRDAWNMPFVVNLKIVPVHKLLSNFLTKSRIITSNLAYFTLQNELYYKSMWPTLFAKMSHFDITYKP